MFLFSIQVVIHMYIYIYIYISTLSYYTYKYISSMAVGSIPIKKVYIDSRFKTKESRSNSDFKFELVQSIPLPDKCVALVDDIINTSELV